MSVQQKQNEDYGKQFRKAMKAGCHSLGEYMSLPHNQEYLMQVVLRPHLASNLELKSPEVYETAIRVARDLGVLNAIHQWWNTVGARADEGDGDESQSAFWFIAAIYFLGVLSGYLYLYLKKYRAERPKATRTVAVQSPTTYTELKGNARPRFKPLSEHSHGATEE